MTATRPQILAGLRSQIERDVVDRVAARALDKSDPAWHGYATAIAIEYKHRSRRNRIPSRLALRRMERATRDLERVLAAGFAAGVAELDT